MSAAFQNYFEKVAELGRTKTGGVRLAPHSTYFGPGFLGDAAVHVTPATMARVNRGFLHEPAPHVFGVGPDRCRLRNGHVEVPTDMAGATKADKVSWSITACP